MIAPLVVPPAPVAEAPEFAVEQARTAVPQVIDVVNPPPPPEAPKVDFVTQVNTVIENKPTIVVNNTVVANHWTYLDYDEYHRPTFYNPYTEAFTVRYFYDNAYRTVYVPAGARISISVAVVGIFPFTAVSTNYVQVGSFCGGSYIPPRGWVGPPPESWRPPPPPVIYTNRVVRVVSLNRTVRVNKVTVVGHDDNAPVGRRDAFMLDDSTLAWGQVKPDGQIDIAASQSLPGVSAIDDGSSLVDTALAAQNDSTSYLAWVLGTLVVVLAAVIGAIGWVRKHPTAAHAADASPPTDRLNW